MTRDWDHNSMRNCDPGSWFNVEFWPGVIIPRWIVNPGHNSTLKCDPGSWFHVELLPGSRLHVEIRSRVMIPRWKVTLGLDSTLKYGPRSEWIPRWIVTPSHDKTLNCDLGLGSQFNVELWPGVISQRGIFTRGQNSTLNFDPGSQFNVEFWLVYISSIRGIATQDGVKIQQRDQNLTAKEGHNSTKNPLNIDPGSVFNRGVKILSYTGVI